MWLMFLVLIGCTLANPKAVYPQWTTNGNDINNTNTGNVGVGTSAPAAKLTVSNNTQAAPAGQPGTTAQIVGANGTSTRLLVDSFGAVVSSIDMRRANNTAQSPSGLANGDMLGQITWQGFGATSYNSASRAKITVSAAETYTDTAQGAYMNFYVAPRGGITSVEAMRIDATGFIGIGTTAPAYRLDLQGGQINSSGGFCIAGDCKTAWSQVGGSSQWTTSGSTIYYNAGNVGIGTSAAPTRKLEVLGGNVFHQYSTTAGSEFGFYTAINNNHFTSNLYYDGLWKMIGTGKGAVISVGPNNGGQAFAVWGDNTSRAANATSSLSQLLGVTMGGNVGIGTGAPDSLAKLHLYGSGYFGQDIQTTSNEWTRLRLMTPSRTWGWFLDGGTGGLGTGKFGLYDYTANAFRMVYDTAGNVGIGTMSPVYSLDVSGGVNGFRAKAATASSTDAVAVFENNSAIQMIVRGDGNVGIGTTSPTEKLEVTGNIKVSGNINAKYQDVAEWVDSSQQLRAGTVVVLDPAKSNQVIASSQSYDSRVAGVISVRPGLTLGEEGEGRVLVATTGRVKVRVDATNGPINIGDLLVTSEKEGVAMKSLPVEIGGVRIHRPGTLIGKALEPLAQGAGEILVLLSLQ